MTALDFSPLTTPVSKADLRTFRRQNSFWGEPVIRGILGIAAVLFVVLIAWMVLATTMFGSADAGSGQGALTLVVVVALASAITVLLALNSRQVWRRRYRMSHFASANALVFATGSGSPEYAGAIFQQGRSQRVTENFYRIGADAIDIGNYRYTTGSGKNQKNHDWGYVAIKLDRRLPHMVLDARANNFLGTNLPTTFARNQVLSLEGDFDRYFTLYCPKEYESDALYVFTPDLMARLIDEAAELDVEIVDDWMFFYSSKIFDLADPDTVAGLFRIIDLVGEKTRDQTRRYADPRVASVAGASSATALGARLSANRIARNGQRLSKGLPVVGLIIFAAVIVLWVANFVPFFTSR